MRLKMLPCPLRIAALSVATLILQPVVGHADQANGGPDEIYDRIGAAALSTNRTPGFSLAVVRGGKLVYAKGFGLADVAAGTPVTAETRFAVGSLTKEFTAASILLLAERHALSLDDPIATFLPEFPNGGAITLRMLLDHTSGLHDYPIAKDHPWPTSGAIELSTIVSTLETDEPDARPGTAYAYSNANYALLSAVIAKVTHSSEPAFLATNVFDPLKMTSSGYGFAAQTGLATPYVGPAPYEPVVPQISLDLYAGAGALVSSASDLAAWDIALMHGSLLDDPSTRELWHAGTLASGTPVPYAMGFVPKTLAGHREVWHNGLAAGAGGYCFNAIFPDDDLAVVVLSDGKAFDGVPERMVSRVLAAFDHDESSVPIARATPRAVATALPVAVPAPAAPSASAPGENLAITARAKDWFHRLQTGTVDPAMLTPEAKTRFTPDFLTFVMANLADLGTPTHWLYVGSEAQPGVTIYTYQIDLAGSSHLFDFGVATSGKITGSLLR